MVWLLLLFSNWTFADDTKCTYPMPPIVPVQEKYNKDYEITVDRGLERSFSPSIQGKNIEVKFSTYPSTTTPAKGTILFLCGGPGVPCIGGRHPSIPKDYDLISVDYLGVGQNQKHNQPKLMSIESQGEMVAKLAKQLNEPNLIIFAQSFGTTVGTVAASNFSKLNSQKSKTVLKGILLEGTFSKTNKTYQEAYKQEADRAWNYLNHEQKRKFHSEYSKLTSQISESKKFEVDANIAMNLQSGTVSYVNYLKNFKAKDYSEIEDTYRNFQNRPESRAITQAAGCQIHLSNPQKETLSVFDGKVAVRTISDSSEQICKCRTVKNDFDPKNHQIKVPIVYLQGEQDPATPLEMARNHFNGQTQAEKVFIAIPNGGHSESAAGFSKCMPYLIDSLLTQNLNSIKARQNDLVTKGCSNQNFSAPNASR